ncbi:conserved Plasmodium membrane protein, unknown function [Plasmodium sp. gorilla clade G2]|uniref:conserved Plasmodium membrane protein, unknown function n=1 Tax=Plasmodium sp. gorilla clade G2 TaxID=880535 RepID=UPI000D225BAE|nr:conserved Plasmodium membrane protein, unknown function [Plasmodium sp. gorilla clade G2]SOV19184.1 conserved Plasmodium membrane protein, unknown function [Plasmodium sp. gorilla clade G2]
MKLSHLIILNYLFFDNLNGIRSKNISHKEDDCGASELAIQKLQELKKFELDILKDFIKKDTDHTDMYKRYHCISSDFLKNPIKQDKKKDNYINKQEKTDIDNSYNYVSNNKNEKTSFINKIISFVGMWNYKKYVNDIKEPKNEKINIYNNNKTSKEILYNKKDQTNHIPTNENPNSYMQLSAFNLTKKSMFLGGKDNASQNFEVGNYGSFYMIFGARNTDYPWACSCDPLQLEEYKEKKRSYVLCSNQLDMSIQNSDLFCNPKNGAQYYYLSYFILFLLFITYI